MVLKKVKFSSPQLIIAWNFPRCTSTNLFTTLYSLENFKSFRFMQNLSALFCLIPNLPAWRKSTPSSTAVGGSRSQTGFFGGTPLGGRSQGRASCRQGACKIQHTNVNTNTNTNTKQIIVVPTKPHLKLQCSATSNDMQCMQWKYSWKQQSSKHSIVFKMKLK